MHIDNFTRVLFLKIINQFELTTVAVAIIVQSAHSSIISSLQSIINVSIKSVLPKNNNVSIKSVFQIALFLQLKQWHKIKIKNQIILNLPMYAVSISCAKGSIACPAIAGRESIISSLQSIIRYRVCSHTVLRKKIVKLRHCKTSSWRGKLE